MSKNTGLRNHLAERIWAIRKIQLTAFPKYCLSRGMRPFVLSTLSAESSLEQILWAVIVPDGDYLFGQDQKLLLQLSRRVEEGLDLSGITLIARTAPVPWESYTEEVFDVTTEVCETDDQFGDRIETYWRQHLQNSLTREIDKAQYATYLELKAKFEGNSYWS